MTSTALPDLREPVGRDRDLDVIDDFLASAVRGGGALLFTGEHGIGKSVLLDAAEERAATAGVRVLRAAGSESEGMSYGGLNELLLPLRGDIDRLDDLQRDALTVALGYDDGPARDRLVVSNAVLALLRRAAAAGPVLLVVDNLQWVDRASVLVLDFVVRRLHGHPVALIAAARTGASRTGVLDLPGHEVQPLDEDAADRLVAERFPGLAAAVRKRIVDDARGNPLVLVELPVGLSPRQRWGQAPLPRSLPLGARLQALLLSRLADLPQVTGYLLLLAVLEGTGDLAVLRQAAAGWWGDDDLAPILQAGLAYVDDDAQRLVLAHPVIRAGVLDQSATGAVRQAHLALAEQLHDQPERRAWHLAGAAVEWNRRPGSPSARALRQPQDPGDADQARQYATASYVTANVLGDLGAAEALLADARRAWPVYEPSAETAFATAFVLLHEDGDVTAAHDLLLRGMAAVRTGDAGPLGAEQAVWILTAVCRLSDSAEHWASLERLIATSGTVITADSLAAARSALDPAGAHGPRFHSLAGPSEPAQVVQMALAAVAVDRLADWRQDLRRVSRAAGGAPAMQAGILLALEAFQAGQWAEARRLAETAAAECASRDYQLLFQQAQAVLAAVAASSGETAEAQTVADGMARWAAPRRIAHLTAAAHYAGGLAALAGSDFPEAYQRAVGISAAGDIPSRRPFAGWAVLDLVEAAVHTGRHGEAVAHVEAARRVGLAAISPRMALLTGAAAAMIAPDGDAPALFEQALATDGAERWPFEQARIHLLYGERLRRLRAVGTARSHLGAAFQGFRALGAPDWANRASRALRATGQVSPEPGNSAHQLLTPHELEIGRLAAAGLTNKEIGARLFMSHRTVASHLYKIFPKLGITSRAALGTVLPRAE